ncbi:hypothetical protein Tco_0180335 [Tanacetum coccineum]
MADNRTMAQMLQAPIEGYEDAIVVPPINANNFELKQPLINLVQTRSSKTTSDKSVKLLLFPFSLDGEARDWLDKEPPRSILTWDDLNQMPQEGLANIEKKVKVRTTEVVLMMSSFARNDDQIVNLICGDAPSISLNNLRFIKKVDSSLMFTCEEADAFIAIDDEQFHQFYNATTMDPRVTFSFLMHFSTVIH